MLENINKKTGILYLIGVLIIVTMIFFSITPLELLMKKQSYSGTTGKIIETTTHNMSSSNGREIRYTYTVNNQEYTSFNLYGLTSFTKMPDDDICIVYYNAEDPENTSITSLEIHEVMVSWLIKELVALFVGLIYLVVYFQVSKTKED